MEQTLHPFFFRNRFDDVLEDLGGESGEGRVVVEVVITVVLRSMSEHEGAVSRKPLHHGKEYYVDDVRPGGTLEEMTKSGGRAS